MTKVYFYPKIKLKPNDTQNSYASDFENAVAIHHEVVNKKINSKGVLDFFKYLNRTDVFLFNWIEDIPRRKFGKAQVLFFIVFLQFRKLFGNKIVWVLHNKYSHNLAKNWWTDLMFKLIMRNSDLILTHSNEGKNFVKENYPRYVDKVKYEIHPIKQKLKSVTAQKKYDFLFWGKIYPYKNIVEFLKYIKTRSDIDSPKILIVGQCFEQAYEKELKSCLNNNIIFENEFYEMDAIGDLATQSKYILFTYSPQSVLSSGALMDSIRMNTEIIGPNHGSFKDLAFLPGIHVFDTYDDIIETFKNGENGAAARNSNQHAIDEFILENSWAKFGDRFQENIKQLIS